jgi:hypothetical protein
MLSNWLYSRLRRTEPTLSKNAQRRLAHTSVVHDGPMYNRRGRATHVRWLRFDIGRFLDRSKYTP